MSLRVRQPNDFMQSTASSSYKPKFPNFFKRNKDAKKVVMQIISDDHVDEIPYGYTDDRGGSLLSRPGASMLSRNNMSLQKSDLRSYLTRWNKKINKSELVNRKIVLNPFETIFKMRVQRYKMYFILMIFGIIISVV